MGEFMLGLNKWNNDNTFAFYCLFAKNAEHNKMWLAVAKAKLTSCSVGVKKTIIHSPKEMHIHSSMLKRKPLLFDSVSVLMMTKMARLSYNSVKSSITMNE